MIPGRLDCLDSVLFIITRIVRSCSISREFPETRDGFRRPPMEKKTNVNYMKVLDLAAGGLLFIAGINWALIGLIEFNLIESIFGGASYPSRLIYLLMGAAALYDALLWGSIQRRWECAGFFGGAEIRAA
jgi:uncharacterized protein